MVRQRILCPYCRQTTACPMGRRPTQAKGAVQQWRCSHCGRWQSEPDDRYHGLFPRFRCRVPSGRLFKAFGLLVVGVPMDWIEKQLKIKAETIRKHFWLSINHERWEILKPELERIGVPKNLLAPFDEAALECLFDQNFFRIRWLEF